MVTLSYILPLLNEGDWFAVVDLNNVHFHISIRPTFHRCPQFALADKVYKFQVLPFEFAAVPRILTKCMALIAAYLHIRGIIIFP